jgi:hypothetical protein
MPNLFVMLTFLLPSHQNLLAIGKKVVDSDSTNVVARRGPR